MRAILHAFRDPMYGWLGVEVFAEGSRNPHVREVPRRNETELKEAFSTALKKTQDAGQVDTGLSSEQPAEILLVLFAGLSHELLWTLTTIRSNCPMRLKHVWCAFSVRFRDTPTS
jgi:hypothetical protein